MFRSRNCSHWRRRATIAAGLGLIGLVTPALAETDVLTHHYDTMRTGWNRNENSLTPANVASSFGLVATVALDDQVDAQPLVRHGETVHNLVTGVTTVQDVVYVVTENNSLYMLDASTGKQLLFRNFGPPVPSSLLSCSSTASDIGITSTPVLDPAKNTLYLISHTYEGSPKAAVYRIHAVNMSDLADADNEPPVVVSASETLQDGSTYHFDSLHSRQKSALLEAGGVIYAGFSSYCDQPGTTRGWLMGWNAASLKPLHAQELTDRIGAKPHTSYLSSIWMSGSGTAADPNGDLFFVTGNSDPGGKTYEDDGNLAESVVRISPDLTDIRDYFTPSDNSANASGTGMMALDKIDFDLGAGGVLLLPTQGGSTPDLAAVAGKDGHLYLLNRDNLGGYNPNGANRVLGTYYVGQCWCAPSYYVGSDRVSRVVTSGGNSVRTWKVQSSGSAKLVAEYTSEGFANVEDPGFFTTISSHGEAGAAIVWAVTRPATTTGPRLTLRAFDPAQGLKMIFSADAGSWQNYKADATAVPTVANGKVYVAAYKALSIFGLHTN